MSSLFGRAHGDTSGAAVRPRGYAFDFDDLLALLYLDHDEPTDNADIGTIQEILVRRGAASAGEHPDREQESPHGRPPLHLVPEPDTGHSP